MTDVDQPKPKRNTRFPPGYTPTTRRRKGVQNKITRDIKNGIITAAVRMGRDGKGAGGLIGYFEFLAKKKPIAFAHLLGKLIPLQLDGELGVKVGLTKVNIISVPSAHYLTDDQISGKEPLLDGVVIDPAALAPAAEPAAVELAQPAVEPAPAAADEPSAELISFPKRQTGDQK
jgi:hypothetical protein